ncbi:MAG TPA: dockerin type I repeat-containing protein [Tepidanaerobacteraceae bacterium]|nr:dockerin type I repeat-containing protein [Tepidanaerobacteraceae bacterium]
MFAAADCYCSCLQLCFCRATLLYGDLNSDGLIDSTDLTMMKRVILRKLTADDITAADLDGDGELNSTDITLLKRYILKKITKFPVEELNPAITPTPTQEPTPTPTETNEEVFAFKIKIDDKDLTYSFPIESSQTEYNIVVDWGDGIISEITDYSAREHEYGEEGIYTIKVLSFDNMPHVPA